MHAVADVVSHCSLVLDTICGRKLKVLLHIIRTCGFESSVGAVAGQTAAAQPGSIRRVTLDLYHRLWFRVWVSYMLTCMFVKTSMPQKTIPEWGNVL